MPYGGRDLGQHWLRWWHQAMGLLPDTLKVRIAHAPGMPEMFYSPPTAKETICITACASCMDRKNVPCIPGACTTHNFKHLTRDPLPEPILTDHQWSPVTFILGHFSQEMPQPSITKFDLKITYLIFHSNFPGANELRYKQHSTSAILVCS